jgi:hypothetical protein
MNNERLARNIKQLLEQEGLRNIAVIVRDNRIDIDAFAPRYSHDVDPVDYGFSKVEVTVKLTR